METSVETLAIRALGSLAVQTAGVPCPLPRSRKVRALLGYLALAPGPVTRDKLCGLLWDVPNDPKAELRWCLSKVRGVIGDRIVATPETVALDRSAIRVDALAIDEAVAAGIDRLTDAQLAETRGQFGGDLLDGLHVDCLEFTSWLATKRQHYRTVHIALVEESVRRSRGSDIFTQLEAWLQLAPFDTRAHEALLGALAQRGRSREAADHLAATIRAFEQEGIDWLPLRDACKPKVEVATPVIVAAAEPPRARTRGRASVAVMPFVDRDGRAGDGITEDIITRLAKLRALFVIARGTVYALADRNIGAQEAGRILDVEYVVSGSVRRNSTRMSILIELAETRDAHVVWADELTCGVDAAFAAVDDVVARIVAAIADEIETAETRRAILASPSSLDAWDAYHRGLWHMYKFTGDDNRTAEHFFRTSLQLDPTFARAHAGLSFTHFQNAFLDLTADRQAQIDQAYATAARSIDADDRDPAAHWAMGRALWLRGSMDESLAELHRSIDLSPNFALGHYTLGFVEGQSGDPHKAIAACDYSRQLSPFDPLVFGMLASRAVAQVRLGELDEAAEWAVKAAARPNAHAHILAIAAECLALAERIDEARDFVGRIRRRLPGYRVEDLLRAFRYDADTERLFRRTARDIDFE